MALEEGENHVVDQRWSVLWNKYASCIVAIVSVGMPLRSGCRHRRGCLTCYAGIICVISDLRECLIFKIILPLSQKIKTKEGRSHAHQTLSSRALQSRHSFQHASQGTASNIQHETDRRRCPSDELQSSGSFINNSSIFIFVASPFNAGGVR